MPAVSGPPAGRASLSQADPAPRRPRPWRLGLAALVLGGVAAVGLLLVTEGDLTRLGRSYHGVEVADRPAAPEFALTDHDRRALRLSDLRGSAVLLYFGYTNCKTACPVTLIQWQRAAQLLGSDLARVRFIFLSVDPERDTPEQLKAHLSQFPPAAVRGLTGARGDLEDLATSYLAYFKEQTADLEMEEARGVTITHTTATFVIDPAGRLALAFPVGFAPEKIAGDLRRLLRER